MLKINKNFNGGNANSKTKIDLTLDTIQYCEKCHKYIVLNDRVFVYDFKDPKNKTGVLVSMVCKDCWCKED